MIGACWLHVHKVGANCLNAGLVLTELGQKCTQGISSSSLSSYNPFQPATVTTKFLVFSLSGKSGEPSLSCVVATPNILIPLYRHNKNSIINAKTAVSNIEDISKLQVSILS